MWFDAHAHCADLDDTRLDTVMRNAAQAGVTAVLNTGTDLETSEKARAQCVRHPSLRAAAGISPFDTGAAPAGWQARLENLLADPAVVALGETGLDSSNPRYPPISMQQPLFEAQVALALRLDKPLVVHSRGAEARVVDICRSIGARRVMFHCFTGSQQDLRRVLDAGYWVSFSGIVTFPGSQTARLAAFPPLEQLLIETDSPYLSPVPYRGTPNESSRAAVVGQAVATARAMDPAQLAAAVRAAFRTLFGWPPDDPA